MSGERGIIYPGDKRVELDGGLNNKFERSIILDNESPDCANVVFENGAVATREGTTKVTTSGIGSFAFDNIYTRKVNTGAETMVAFAKGSMWNFQTNTFVTIPSAQSVFTAGVNISTAQYENYMFIGNGGVVPYKYNENFTRHGVYPPSSAATASSKNVGLLNGNYKWKITFVNSGLVESDVNSFTTGTAITSGTASLACIPVAPISYGVNARRLYRTVTSGTTYMFVATINDNTSTTYEDTTADASLGAVAPDDQGVPPNYSIIIYYRDRLFMNDPSNPNYVWYTELGNPYVVKAENFFKIGDNTTDVARCFGIIQNTLVIFGDETINFLYMPDSEPTNWSMITGEKQYGCKSPLGVANIDGMLVFPAVQNDRFIGFAGLTGSGIQPSQSFLTVINAGSKTLSDRIEPSMNLVQESYIQNVSAIVFNDTAYFCVTHGQGNEYNNRIWIYDTSISNLSKNQKFTWVPFTGMNPKQMTILDGELYFASSYSNDGHVYNLFDGSYNDNGLAIDSYIWTKEFGGAKQHFHNHKDFKDLYLLSETPGNWSMDITVRVDSDTGSGDTTAVLLNPGGMLWGDDWGASSWGGGSAQSEKILRLYQSGKRIQFKISNQNVANQYFKIHALGFKYNRKGLR